MKNEIKPIEADTKKSTFLLKKHLKDIFGIDVKIKSEFYSMGCSLNISYELGVSSDEVENVVKKLEYGRFDGMTDLSYSVDVDGLTVDGFKLKEFKHVFVRQTISDDLKFKLAKMISDTMKLGSEEEEVPALMEKEQMNTYFRSSFGDTWGQILYRMCQIFNFATQDESKINLLSVHSSEAHNGKVYFLYEVDGIQYNTEELPQRDVKAPTKPQIEKVEVISGKVQIIEYSERAIAVIGDTKPIKDKLKALGGKFNFRLTCGAGWIFRKSDLEKVKEALKPTTLKDEIQKTVDFFAETDKKIYGFVTPQVMEIVRVQKCNLPNHV